MVDGRGPDLRRSTHSFYLRRQEDEMRGAIWLLPLPSILLTGFMFPREAVILIGFALLLVMVSEKRFSKTME